MDTKQINKRFDELEMLLLCLKTIFSFSEGAKYLNLSESYLYKLTSTGKIKHSKPNGKKIYFSKQNLDNFLMQNQRATTGEIDRQAATYVTTGQKGGQK